MLDDSEHNSRANYGSFIALSQGTGMLQGLHDNQVLVAIFWYHRHLTALKHLTTCRYT